VKQSVATTLRYEAELIKGSRFIADIGPAADETQAKDFLARVRTDFPDASHHCSAWRIAQPAIDRANDDGEPGGSAGRPILSQLTGRDLVDTIAVVTRWFGGTKLGVGGLVRAYGGVAGEALDTMELHPWVVMTEVSLVHGYAHADAIERLVADLGGEFTDRTFEARVTCTVRLPESSVAEYTRRVADATNGDFTLLD